MVIISVILNWLFLLLKVPYVYKLITTSSAVLPVVR